MQDILNIIGDNWQLLLIGQYPHGPLGGLAVTLLLSVLGIAFAFPLGVALALCRISPFSWLRIPSTCIVYLVRGVPLIMFIFWTYFVVPILLGRPVAGFTVMLVTVVIYQSAYLAEIVRAGMLGLPAGQTEAARAVGLSYMQTTFKVLLPQAIYNMVPAIISQFVASIKDTALAYVVSVNELTLAASQVNANLLTMPFQVYLLLAGIYFVVCFAFTELARHLERRIADRRAGTQRSATTPAPLNAAAQSA
jgi:polar amino acid transport system permease protein